MAGEYGIERAIILPEVPLLLGHSIEVKLLVDQLRTYFTQQREAIAAAYDELGKRLNELSYEAHWGSETPAQITAGQNNYQLGTAIVHRLSSDANWTISGFVAPFIEQMHVLLNVGTNDIVIAHDSGGSDTVNKVLTVSGANVTVGARDSMIIWYDLTSARWRELVP